MLSPMGQLLSPMGQLLSPMGHPLLLQMQLLPLMRLLLMQLQLLITQMHWSLCLTLPSSYMPRYCCVLPCWPCWDKQVDAEHFAVGLSLLQL